eukprot:Phypoly_transcript_13243.p1 GENE.Phypoly_transcript_13243~~Phypoly_transcript_13243.p1  ORF type:complete len:250 (+),score=45.31 Phypoly_transcript_13243:68-751(+)
MSKAAALLQQFQKLSAIQFKVGSDVLNVVRGGHGKPAFVFIHGANREKQNAEYWAPQLSWLKNSFFFVDMLGHGNSVPNATEKGPDVAIERQVNAIVSFLQSPEVESPVLLVGRSYGGKVAVEGAKAAPTHVKSLILIAPAIKPADIEKLPDSIKKEKILVVTAEDDPIVDPAKTKSIADHLPNARLYSAGKVITNEAESWQAHCPEMVHPEKFGEEVHAFLKELSP